MRRQDTHILKALLTGRVHTPFPDAAKVMAQVAPSFPIIYMGDRDLSTDEVLNYEPSAGDIPSLMGESTYSQYIFMVKMANYIMNVEDMPVSAREQHRRGDVDIWAYINHNPSTRLVYDEDGEEIGKHSIPVMEEYEEEPAVEAKAAVTEKRLVSEAVKAVAKKELIIKPEAVIEKKAWVNSH